MKITRRDYLAAQAMKSILRAEGMKASPGDVAYQAYSVAASMLRHSAEDTGKTAAELGEEELEVELL